MRYFFSRRIPTANRLLLVESGSRRLIENLLPHVPLAFGEQAQIDLVTCYGGLPAGLAPETTRVYNVNDYPGRAGRKRLYRELKARRYDVMGILCSAEPIMLKWKFALGLQVPAKIFILNENGDFFWFDYSAWRIIRLLVMFRAGLSGAGAVRTLARVFLFPFTLSYLLLYAATVHLRRKVH